MKKNVFVCDCCFLQCHVCGCKRRNQGENYTLDDCSGICGDGEDYFIESNECFSTCFPEDGENSSVILCPSGHCHTLISQVMVRGNLSIRRACYGQNQEKHQHPREYILNFVLFCCHIAGIGTECRGTGE